MTGPVVVDFKGDRIMDYQVWYLASASDKFDRYMKIPLTKAGRNATACVKWLVKLYNNMHVRFYQDTGFRNIVNFFAPKSSFSIQHPYST